MVEDLKMIINVSVVCGVSVWRGLIGVFLCMVGLGSALH
jgi:hypothetical protein